MTATQLADILKKRNIKKVCYFHTDHFEPWSRTINEEAARGVENFFKQSKKSRFAEALTLFYHTYLPYNLDPALVKRNEPGVDAVIFGNRTELQNKLARAVMTPLEQEGKHEVHIHIHHEGWTRNTGEYSKEIARWVNQNSTAEMDFARMERGILLTKEFINHDISRPIEKWAFIHGNWALNGSDRSICWIDDEMSLLMKHGCFGDFTFPAGRGHCNPTILETPYTCLPLSRPKGYDLQESMPIVAAKESNCFSDDRFFIWSSEIKADFASIDYYYAPNRALFQNHALVVKNWIEKGVLLGDILYIKTHAHSMKSEYEMEKGEQPIPHLLPDIMEIFNLLEKTCELAALELEVITVNKLMEQLAALCKSPDNADDGLASGANSAAGSLSSANPMEAAISQWIEKPGSSESMGGFYKKRFEEKKWLDDYEVAVINHIKTLYKPEETRIVEIGCGLGTLSAALALSGYQVFAVEGDRRRATGAHEIKTLLSSHSGNELNNYQIIEGLYPEILEPRLFDKDKTNILLGTNIIHSHTAENQDAIVRSALLFDRVILDLSSFGVWRGDDEIAQEKSRQSLNERFAQSASIYQNEKKSISEYLPRNPLSPVVQELNALREVDVVNALSLEICKNYLSELEKAGQTDALITDKANRSSLVDKREVAILQQLVRIYEPSETRIIEIGSACGTLSMLLARQGFEVIGFEGNVKRAKVADSLLNAWTQKFPDQALALTYIPHLFPKGYNQELVLTDKRTVVIATNIVSSYSGENQERILLAACNFDELIIDLGRFGINRDKAEQRLQLLASMSLTHFQPISPLYTQGSNDYWRFKTESGALNI